MRRYIPVIAFLALIMISSRTEAQAGLGPGLPELPPDLIYQTPLSPNKPEKIVEAYQAEILRSMFLTPLIKQDAIDELVEDEEEDGLISADSGFYDDILIKQFSETLAEQDILQLKKQLLKAAGVLPENAGKRDHSVY